MSKDLPVIQQMYDLILWYVPLLNKMPRNFKFTLGERIQTELYGILDGLVTARWSREKSEILEKLNARLDVLRYQTRLCYDFHLFDERRYEHVARLINEIGKSLGGWKKSLVAKNR